METMIAEKQQRYSTKLNGHLVEYKRETLRVEESGSWIARGKNVQHPHILPKERAALNLLPVYRQACNDYLRTARPKIKKHQYFHHLNSSQAMCLNLFFPFQSDASLIPILLDALRLPQGAPKGEFEKVFDTEENTNFDFFLDYGDGFDKVFFELKLSEQGFGTAKRSLWDEKYQAKFVRHYQPHLEGFVPPKWLEQEEFLNHYQILRNLSYLRRHPGSKLYFIFPKANESLAKSEQAITELGTLPWIQDRMFIVHLESLINQLISRTVADGRLLDHLHDFRQKYIV
jgi:hypothetical protein